MSDNLNKAVEEILYPYFYGFMIREVWAKGGKDLTSSEEETCQGLAKQAAQALTTVINNENIAYQKELLADYKQDILEARIEELEWAHSQESYPIYVNIENRIKELKATLKKGSK